jgi:Helicase associated domain
MNEEVADEVSTIALSKCTEKDVLLGRGNRNNAWPGNIHFRSVAMKYRDEYSKVNRCQKVEIALKVINEITTSGGRFVQVDHDAYNCSSSLDMYCFEVDRARSIEKTCQVLREKSTSKYKPLKAMGENSEYLGLNSKGGSFEKDETGYHEHNPYHGVAPNTEKNDVGSLFHGIDRHQREARRSKSMFCTDEMLKRLRCFHSKYGHANVPSNWSQDIVLADWCCVQRHLYRETQSGCWSSPIKNGTAPLTNDAQSKLFEDLNSVNFAWDYEEWHWNLWYSKLVARDDIDLSSPSIKVWIRNQRRKYQMGILSAERAEKLKQAGVLFL